MQAWRTRGQIFVARSAFPLIVLETTNRKTAFVREIRIEQGRTELEVSLSIDRRRSKAPFLSLVISPSPQSLTPSFVVRAFPRTKEERRRKGLFVAQVREREVRVPRRRREQDEDKEAG